MIARNLFYAHGVVVCLGLCAGILEIIKRWQTEANFEGVEGGSGNLGSGMMSGGLGIILAIGFPVLLPIFALMVARSAVALNHESRLQSLCIFDGCCSCCNGLVAINCIQQFVAMLAAKTYIRDITCQSKHYVLADGTVKEHSLMDQNQRYDEGTCEAAKIAAIKTTELWAGIALVVAVLSLIEMIACGIGTWSANLGYNALATNEVVFVGLPQPPMGADMFDGGVITVIGQPVTSGVVMGMPVGGAPGQGASPADFVEATPVRGQT